MALKWPHPKDPASDLDYICNWGGKWLGSDTIQVSTWELPNGITSTGDSHNDSVTTIWLDGGTDGVTYTLINTILTVGGRTAQRDIKLKVKNN